MALSKVVFSAGQQMTLSLTLRAPGEDTVERRARLEPCRKGFALDGFSRRGTLFETHRAKSCLFAFEFSIEDWKDVPQGLKSLRESQDFRAKSIRLCVDKYPKSIRILRDFRVLTQTLKPHQRQCCGTAEAVPFVINATRNWLRVRQHPINRRNLIFVRLSSRQSNQ